MGRPYGIGFYGTHQYSSGSYAPLAAQAEAQGTAYAGPVRLFGRAGTAGANVNAYARQPDTLADRATFLRGDTSAAAGAGITLDRATAAVRASSRAWAGPDRIQSEATLGPVALLNSVGVGYVAQSETLADRAAFSDAQSSARALSGKLALSMGYEAARTTATSQAEVNFFSATHLSAQATAYAYTSGRFAWEPGDVTDTGGWGPQDPPGTVWVWQDPSPTEWN